GYGLDPDPRYGKRPGRPATAVTTTIFRTGGEVAAFPSDGWDAAVVTAHFGAAVIAQDEALDATTAAHLAAEVAAAHALPPAEAMRLQVALADLAAADDAVKLTGMKAFIDPLTDAERERACDVVIGIAARAGVVSPSIVALVQKIARLLELDPQSVPSRLFGAMTSDGPMPTTASGPLVLDHATIAATTAATEVVSSLLGGLLVGEDDPASQSAPEMPIPSASATIPGLDAAHTALLHALAASGEDRWEGARLDALAQEHHLLAAGAIDTLNDAALDLMDEPVLIEEGGGFALDRDVLAAMIAPVGTSPMGSGRPD
ncbi:MAG: tellurite resistance TerB C-terminal domain-containing protein, partial [Thermomicrobiales bacterium]